MARKSYALLISLLVTFILLDCLTECAAAKNKGKGKGKARKGKDKGKFREGNPEDIIKCGIGEPVNYICGSNGITYWNAKNMECGKQKYQDLKEADPSRCIAFPKTEHEKKVLENMWKDRIKEITQMGTGAPAAGAPDSGAPAAGAPDSGAPAAGAPDSGAPDSGAPDSGAPATGTARKKYKNKGNNKNDKKNRRKG